MAASIACLDSIPDNIILHILSNLSVKELCLVGRVCHRWRKIVNDNSLWRDVDLCMYQLKLQSLWRIVRSHFTPALRTLKLRGFWDSTSASKRNTNIISNSMLQDLHERCPSIQSLYLFNTKIDQLDAAYLPLTLTTLVLQNCHWKPKWLEKALKQKLLPSLTHLDVSSCVRFDCADLRSVASSGLQITVLKMNGCYRLGDVGLTSLAKYLTNLETLEISEVKLSKLSCHHIGRNCVKLKRLVLSQNSLLTNASLSEITSQTANLEYLDVSHCENVSINNYKFLSALPNLKSLVVCGKVEDCDAIRNLFVDDHPNLKVLID